MKKRASPHPAAHSVPQPVRPAHPKPLAAARPASIPEPRIHWTGQVLFGLFLLTLLTPLIYSSTTFFGFITGRTIYFRLLVGLMVLVALGSRRMLVQPPTRLQLAVLIFGGILALADSVGIDPINSFLSGYSRMEGFLAYGYYILYFLVVARVGFSKKQWNQAISVSVIVSILVVLYGAGQESGWQTDHYRLVATIGNPSYLGLYLLLHLFLAVYLLGQFPAVGRWSRLAFFIVLGGVLLWGMVVTGTRSALLGLGAGGMVLGVGRAALRLGWSGRTLLAGLLVLAVFGALFVGLKATNLTRQSAYVQRLTTFSTKDDTFRPRYLNWKMAVAGIADRPIFGWGQENYSYGFAHHYDPALLNEGTETYDRPHNLLLEIGFSAGLTGLLAYLFVWFFLLRQLRHNPLFAPTDRVALLGLLVAYVAFNLLNFDSLVSAQVFFFVLALLDTPASSVSSPVDKSPTYLPWAVRVAAALVVLIGGYYTINAWQTLRQIDRQSQATSNQNRTEIIEKAYQQARIGQTEVADVLVSLATSLLSSPDIQDTDKRVCYQQAVAALVQERQRHPDNIRLITRQAELYTTHSSLKQASALYDTLLQTDGRRQPGLWVQAGVVHLRDQQSDLAHTQFQEASRRQPSWQLPMIYEALIHTLKGDTAQVRTLMKQVRTPALSRHFSLVKSAFLMNRDTTGLLNRLDRIPYSERNQCPVSLFQEWTLLAFDSHRYDQVSTAIRSFIHSDGIYVYEPKADKMIDEARRGIRPDNIAKLAE